MALDFKFYIIVMGFVYLIIAYTAEHYAFQRIARLIGRVNQAVTGQAKKRKEYKMIQERMRA